MKKISKRWLALALTAAILVGATAVGLSMTYAASYVQERFQQENTYATVEITQANTAILGDIAGVNNVGTSDPKILTATTTTITGVSAGVAAVSVATRLFSGALPVQVTDSSLISGYDLSSNGELNKKSDDPQFDIKASLTVYTTAWNAVADGVVGSNAYSKTDSAKSQITWISRNTAVAECTTAGLVTPKSKGTAVILGDFNDRWGVPHTIAFLVGVDTIVGKSLLSDLSDAIKKAEAILALDPNPYQEAGLGTLQSAVNAGKTLIANNEDDDSVIAPKIKEIEDAVKGLKFKAGIGDGLIPVDDGKGGTTYYKPAGPENVYEVVDENGNSLQPDPKFIYDPNGGLKKDPPEIDKDVVPAYKDGYVYYVEELPQGSNIFVPIKADGTKDDSKAVWGGANGLPEDSDAKAAKSGSTWFAEDPKGSNLWKPVLTSAGAGSDQGKLVSNTGDWVGGGEDGLPSGNDNLYPITVKDGQTVAGPFGTGEDAYYVGMGGDGRFDTTGTGGKPASVDAVSTKDTVLYDQGDGTLGTTKPVTTVKPSNIGPSSLPAATSGTPYNASLTADGDAANWTVTNGSLPTGLTLSTAGVISGTPSTPGTYEFTVKAKNAGGEETKVMTIVVGEPAPTVTITGFSADSGYLKADGSNATLSGKVLVVDDETGEESWVAYVAATHGGTLTWALDPAGQTATITSNKFIKSTAAANTIITVKGTLVTADGTYTAKCNWVVPNEDGTLGGGGTDEPMGVTGRTLTTAQTGDTSVWIEIAQTIVGGKLYSLIVRKDTLNSDAVYFFRSSGTAYDGSNPQKLINDWFRNDGNAGANLAWKANIRNYTVTSDVMDKIGNAYTLSRGWDEFGSFDGFSKPSGTKDKGLPSGEAGGNDTPNIAFLLSFGETARFISKKWYYLADLKTETSNGKAIDNWKALNNSNNTNKLWWHRSIIPMGIGQAPQTGGVGYVSTDGLTLGDSNYSMYINRSHAVRPACWVDSTIFDS